MGDLTVTSVACLVDLTIWDFRIQKDIWGLGLSL